MKILFYYYMGGGGGLSNIILLLRTMARLHPEDSIEIVTSPLAPFDEILDVPNIRIRRFRMTGLKEIDRLLLGVFHLSRIARETKADILWSMNIGPYVKTGLPSVLSMHNPYQVCPWEITRYHPGRPWRVALLRWFFRRSLRISDAVVVQTRLMGDYVRCIRGAPREICIAPKSVERAIDVRSEPLPPFLQGALEKGLGRGTFTFLYVSTFVPHKNHVSLIRAFSELARKNVRVRVILTVEPEEILRVGCPEASGLIEKGYIVPAGWVAKPFLRSLYAACDGCLMPSVMESLSSAHIEAMKWGLPQITADVVYAHEACGPAALYVREDNVSEWVAQIERLMCDEYLRRELIHAGQSRMNLFPASWDDASEAVHRFLESVRIKSND
jgi:glycosyltransferase involved in cell wall biosynthesis